MLYKMVAILYVIILYVSYRKMAAYCKQYEALKGMRTLKWIASLGVVKLDLELAGRTQSFSVSPARAAVIYHFENQGKYWLVAIRH